MFLFCSTVGFVYTLCQTKPALSRFSNALKIIAISFISFVLLCSTHPITPYSPERPFSLRCIYAGGFGGHKSVRPSVTPSVKRVNCDKAKETSASLTPCERAMHLVLQHEEWLVGEVPFYVIFWTKLTHPFEDDFRSQRLRRNTQRRKVQLTLIEHITVPINHSRPSPRKHSPDGAIRADIRLQLTTHLSTPKG